MQYSNEIPREVIERAREIKTRSSTIKTAWPVEDIAKLIALARRNWTALRISEVVGRSRNAVLGFAFRNGIDINRREYRRKPQRDPLEVPPPPVEPKPVVRTHCLWVSDPASATYCDGKPLSGSSWCSEHTKHFRAVVDG